VVDASMKERVANIAILVLAAVFFAGCATKKPGMVAGPAPASMSSSCPTNCVEAATCVYCREAVASVPVEGASQVYQNLHVGLATLVTARNPALYSAREAELLARRLEPKLDAVVVKALVDGPTMSPHKLDHVRDGICEKVQAAAGENLSRWPDAASYSVEVVIVSMYWTDSTVGRPDLGLQ
jgi:hypothetical protein